MSSASTTQDAAEDGVAPPADAPRPRRSGGRKMMIMLAVPLVLAIVGAGLWFGGVLPRLLGLGASHPGPPADQAVTAPPARASVDLPDIVANLNAPGRRSVFVKLHVRIEVARAADAAAIQAAMPRLLDLFQTYLRETHPEELHGAEGTWRLRQELMARADIAAAPVQVTNLLFTEMLVQ